MEQAAARTVAIGITELNELLLEIEGIGYKIFVHKRASFTLIRRAKEVFHGKSSQDLSRQFPVLAEIKKLLQLFQKPNNTSPSSLLAFYDSVFIHRQSYLKSFHQFNDTLRVLSKELLDSTVSHNSIADENHYFEDCQDATADLEHLLSEVGKLRFQLTNDPAERMQLNSLVEQISMELSEWSNLMSEIVELKQHVTSLPSLFILPKASPSSFSTATTASSSSSDNSGRSEGLQSELIYIRRLIEDLQQNSLASQPQQIQMIDSLNDSIINAINDNEIIFTANLKQEIDSVKTLTAKFHEEVLTLLKQQSQETLQQVLLQTSGPTASSRSYTQIQQSIRDEKLRHLRIQSSEIVVGEERLGMGSFGEVRVGQYGNLPIAIKIIQFDGSEKEKLLIENEALLMSLCHHPSILQIYGISYPPPLDRRSTTAYLLLELGRLGSLWSYLCGDLSPSGVHHDISFALSLAWISDIFSALSYLHQLKIIHRDVKAENVLLTLQMNCKLTDFGFAKQQLGSTSGSVTGSSSSLKGSFHFMAPEVKLTQKYSHRSDVYAGCVTAFQILSRSGPPIHDTRRNILLHASTFGPAISSFFNSCLQENPRDRISSAEASKLISEIQQTQNEPDPRHTSPGVPHSSPSRFKTAGKKMQMDPQPSVPAAPPPPPTAPPSELQLWIEDELSSYAGKSGFENHINRLVKIFEDDFIFTREEIVDQRDLYTKEYFRTRDIPLGIASVLSKSIQNFNQVPTIPLSTIRTLFLESWLEQGCTADEIQIDEIIPLTVSSEVNANYARMKSSAPSSTSPLLLWHGTPDLRCTDGNCGKSNCSLCAIVREGFRPENARRETSSYTLFGHSSYFASESMVAHGYNGKNEKVLRGKKRAVILSEVIVNKPLNCASREVINQIQKGGPDMNLQSLSRHLRNLYNSRHCDCFLTKAESFPNEDSGHRVPLIPVHYMVQDGHRILPRYLVTYTYPERFARNLPHDNCDSNSNTNPSYCEFHGMWHQGKYRQCDAYRWYNYAIALLNYD